MLNFHTDLTSPHQYQSWPWQWLLLGRPVAFYWSTDPACGASSCAAEILLLGTPVLWWSFIPALIGTAWFGISRRDWRALAIGAGGAAGIAAVVLLRAATTARCSTSTRCRPSRSWCWRWSTCSAASSTAPAWAGSATGEVRLSLALPADDRRLYGTIFAGAFVLLVAVCFWIYYPIYVGDSIPYTEWFRRMLLGNRWV